MKSYITTPIFYVNAQPHLGHAYTAVVADTYNRFKKLCGSESRFQTGTDEHGDKIAAAATDNDITPQAYADKISGMFRDCWPHLLIEPDNFIRTTDDAHKKVVGKVLQKLYDAGDIVFSDYSGLYCQGCERFLTEKELVDGLCPDHQKAPEEVTESNYFFKMSKYQDWLIRYIESNPEFITPARYRNEVLAFLAEPLEDLCISRPISRLTWGIPLPFDNNFVTYVWFDALLNYLSGLGYDPDGESGELFEKFWPVAEHVIAKDILKPHAIFWPTMLKAMGVAPYRRLHVHGYWNINETKMSKSIGNVVRPLDMVEEYGADGARYFMLREMSFGLDSSFSSEAVVNRYNSDLANDLGNLFSRTMAMVKKFTDGVVPAPPLEKNEIDSQLQDAADEMIQEYCRRMDDFAFHQALRAVWEVISLANKYIVENAPWELAKDAAKRPRLEAVIYNLLETLRLIALPLHAIMPQTAAKMWEILHVPGPADLKTQGQWGGVLVSGTSVQLDGSLFPRLEKKGADKAVKNSPKQEKSAQGKVKKTAKKPAKTVENSAVTFADFQRYDLRVANIVAAEKIKKSERLLKLTVEAPEQRTIVAGIAEYYSPEEVVGKQVIIVANLPPAKLMGVVSQGMVLAAKDADGHLALSTVSGGVMPAGSKVA